MVFYSPEISRYLDEKYYTMKKKIRKQMPDNALTEAVESAGEGTEMGLLLLMVITFGLNFLLSGGMLYFLILVRGL